MRFCSSSMNVNTDLIPGSSPWGGLWAPSTHRGQGSGLGTRQTLCGAVFSLKGISSRGCVVLEGQQGSWCGKRFKCKLSLKLSLPLWFDLMSVWDVKSQLEHSVRLHFVSLSSPVSRLPSTRIFYFPPPSWALKQHILKWGPWVAPRGPRAEQRPDKCFKAKVGAAFTYNWIVILICFSSSFPSTKRTQTGFLGERLYRWEHRA